MTNALPLDVPAAPAASVPGLRDRCPNVAFVHHGGPAGGAALSLLYLLQGIGRPHLTSVLLTRPDPRTASLFESAGARVIPVPMPLFEHTTLGYYRLTNRHDCAKLCRYVQGRQQAEQRLRVVLQALAPDVVHFNSLTLAPYAAVPWRLGIPSVVHVREPLRDGVPGLRSALVRGWLSRYAARVISICQDNLLRLRLDPGKGVVIGNPVDLQKFDHSRSQADAREYLGVPGDGPVLAYVGGSNPVKGPDLFLEVMDAVRITSPETVALMPGYSPPRHFGRTAFRRQICRLAFRRHTAYADRYLTLATLGCVRPSDFTYSVEAVIAAADIVCVTHRVPHFARVVIEAGAMKKPVVAFDVPGVTEAVTQSAGGIIVPLGDTRRMAAEVLRLQGCPAERRRLGDNGHRWVSANHSLDVHTRSVLSVYQHVLPG